MKKIIKEILVAHKERFQPPEFKRSVQLNPDMKKVQTITGPRRSGKSSLLKLAIQDLLNRGVSWSNICYITLEDERLRSDVFEADEILQAFAELYPENALLKDVYFFFDEIQYLNNWEKFINRIHEQINRKVVITGSNSKLLHTEVAGVLRGRGLPIELLPLSFKEYLSWKGIEFSEYGGSKAKVRAAFNHYLFQGGYPETALHNADQNHNLLQEYFNTVLYRDIIDLAQPSNYGYLRYLFHRIADNTGKTSNLLKIYRELKSRGYAVSKSKVYQMADLAEAVYLFKRISRFDPSLIKRENSDKKAYFIDNGMLRALGTRFSENRGKLLENLVFWQLYRQYGNIYTTDIYYYQDTYHECDFILFREGDRPLPIQVCWEMQNEDTKTREISGLIKACEVSGRKKGIIITYDSAEEIEEKGIHIAVIPAWKWCGQELDLLSV